MSLRERGIRGPAWAVLLAACLAGMGARPASGGDALDLTVAGPGTPQGTGIAAPRRSPMAWWSIPRRARVTMRRMAAMQDARVTRCLAVEHEGEVLYEIHARRRRGLLRTEDFVLTRFGEPAEDAEARRQARSWRGRIDRLGDWLWPGSPSLP